MLCIDRQPLLTLEHLVVSLALSISHTSFQYTDFVGIFNLSLELSALNFSNFKPGLHIVVMVVCTVANMFLTLFQAVLIHVKTLITTSL